LPTTVRTMFDVSSRMGMKSMTVTAPVSVSYSVSSTSVPSTYRREMRCGSSAGASNQRPFWALPSRAAKHAPESKRGQQSQSIDPAREMSAAVSQSPIRA
jgi:hypothetical protein